MSSESKGIYDRRQYGVGDMLMEEGDKTTHAFLIQKGRVEVFCQRDGKRASLALLGPGDIIGEMALIIDSPRTASAAAIEETSVIVISRQILMSKLEGGDPTVKALVKSMTERLIRTNQSVLKHVNESDEVGDVIRGMTKNFYGMLSPVNQAAFQEEATPLVNKLIKLFDRYKKNDTYIT